VPKRDLLRAWSDLRHARPGAPITGVRPKEGTGLGYPAKATAVRWPFVGGYWMLLRHAWDLSNGTVFLPVTCG